MKTTAFYFLVFWAWFFALDYLPTNWLMFIIWLWVLIGIAMALENAYTSWEQGRQWQALKRKIAADYCKAGDAIMAKRRKPIITGGDIMKM